MKRLWFVCSVILLLGGCRMKTVETFQRAMPSVSIKALPDFIDRLKVEVAKMEEEKRGPRNPLTGEKIEEAWVYRRPFAVVINNLPKALPQSGISQASLYYEVLAEAGITRIISFFQEVHSEKIGPIRSTRHYFTDFALDHDAIYVHHGGSELGYQFIRSEQIDHLDGMRLEGTTFFRDRERARTKGLEHSSYTNSSLLEKAVVHDGIDLKHEQSYKPMFHFFDAETMPIDGTPARTIHVPFSNTQDVVFEYDDQQNIYTRFQNGTKHIDEENGIQLTVKNVIVQSVPMKVIDDVGRRDVALVGEGNGYLFSQGVVIPILWEKKSHTEPTMWYDMQGELLQLNQGKTWICVFPADHVIDWEPM